MTSIEPVTSSAALASGVPAVWGNVPQRNKNFTGRTHFLRTLRERLVGDSKAAVLQHALYGLGGVGKTQLAMEYSYVYQGSYEVVWWISADQPGLIRSALAALAPRLGLPTMKIDDAVAAVLEALRKGEPYSKWLLVFDNADQPETIQEFMPNGPGHVLITSRDPRWDGVVDAIEIAVFDRAESLEFLNRRVPGITGEDADRLADALGDLPLALEQAGALQAESGMPADQYLQLLEKRASQLLAENRPAGYDLPIAAAWSLSMAQVGEQMPMALELLRRCAFFGPEPFSRDILDYGRYVLDPPLRDLLADPLLVSRATRLLGRHALARIDNNRKTLQVHRLIQRLIREDLSADEAGAMRHDVHRLLAAAAPTDATDPKSWLAFRDLFFHLGPAEVIACRSTDSRQLVTNIVRYLVISGDYAAALGEADLAISIWTGDSGPDDVNVLVVSGLKADALWAVGRYQEAYELRRTTLERMEAVLGPDHEDTLDVTRGYGADLRARGEFAAAEAHDERSVTLHRQVYGDSFGTFAAENNLAVDYGLNSEYARALSRNAQNYTERRVYYGGDDHLMVVFSLNAWARDLRQAGEYLRAREFAERAYEIYRDLISAGQVDEYHPWVLLQAKDLSVNRRKAGSFPAALELADEVYNKYREILEESHPDRLAAGLSLGNALRVENQTTDAAERIRVTVERYEKSLGPAHPFTHGATLNLALVTRQSGDVELARSLLEGALGGLRASLGDDHHYTLTCVTNLATAISGLGDAAAALLLGEDTLRRFRVVLGEDHPHTLVCATNLAQDLLTVGRDDEGRALAAATLDRYLRVLGSAHPDVIAATRGERLDFDFEPPPF